MEEMYDKLSNSTIIKENNISKNLLMAIFTKLDISARRFEAHLKALLTKAIDELDIPMIKLLTKCYSPLKMDMPNSIQDKAIKTNDVRVLKAFMVSGMFISVNHLLLLIPLDNHESLDLIMNYTQQLEMNSSILFFALEKSEYAFDLFKDLVPATHVFRSKDCKLLSLEQIKYFLGHSSDHSLSYNNNATAKQLMNNWGVPNKQESVIQKILSKYPKVMSVAMDEKDTTLIPLVLQKIFLMKNKDSQ